MPTILQNITELIENNYICENGEFNSTGGRRAKMLTIKSHSYCSIGIEITKNDIRCAVIDLDGSLLHYEQYPFCYMNTPEYYLNLGNLVNSFIEKCNDTIIAPQCRLIGVGLALPGVVNPELGILQRSHALHVSNIGLRSFSSNIPYPVCFERDATAAAYSEITSETQDLIYLYLGYSVGGAIYTKGQFFRGDYYRGGGFGHSIIALGGRQCYCGKKGCVAAYCSTDALLASNHSDSLDIFFKKLNNQDPITLEKWNDFLEMLAVTLTNVRMEFDCDIIVGGDISRYLTEYLEYLKKKSLIYNTFDVDASYISIGKYHYEAAAIGVAKKMIDTYIQKLDLPS